MAAKKKLMLITIIAVVAVIAVGSITVTYAWFLSRYSSEYDFVLQADEHVILQYESNFTFASGTQSDAANALVPAVLPWHVGLDQTVYAPMDMFDGTKMDSIASNVRFTAKGAYWTGSASTLGEFSFNLSATVVGESSSYDLVANGEIAYVVIFRYLGKSILLYEGNYYTNVGEGAADFTLPSAVNSAIDMANWYLITSSDRVREIEGANYLLLTPNTEFECDLYAFVGKPDELLDPAINGKTITLSATIAVQ